MHISYKKYAFGLLLLITVAITGLGGYVMANDPYWLWHRQPPWHQAWGGHNRVLDIRHRFAKAIQVVTRRPEIVIIGSSRVYRGIDTENCGQARIYNLGLSSLRIREARAYIRHCQRWTPVEHIVLGLDYFMFDAHKPSQPGFDHDLGDHKFLFKSLPVTLLTRMALKDVRRARKGVHSGDGYWTYSGFKITNPRNAEDIQRIYKGFYKKPTDISEAEYAVYETILEECARIDLRIYISPMQARQIEKMKLEGEYLNFEQWKGRIRAISAEHGIELHDFSTENPFFDEEVHDASTVHWIDTSHFSPEVGAWILQRIGLSSA